MKLIESNSNKKAILSFRMRERKRKRTTDSFQYYIQFFVSVKVGRCPWFSFVCKLVLIGWIEFHRLSISIHPRIKLIIHSFYFFVIKMGKKQHQS